MSASTKSEPATEEPAAQEPPPVVVADRPLETVRAREVGLVLLLCLAIFVPLLGNSSLWDPWETHYGEVARRMLEEEDWVRLRWQDENFRSKPVLTFWMMGAGMKLLGVGDGGGFSGEFVSSARVEWAIRLPFALSGVGGLVILWVALARLVSRRMAWLGTTILASCPYYFMITRQAITDMPSCAMLIGSMSLLALAIFDDAPLRRGRWGWNAHHVFLVVLTIVMVPQLVYFVGNLETSRWMLSRRSWIPGPWMMLPFALGFLAIAVWSARTCKTRGQAYMYWFYLLSGIAVLAKGPVSPALAGLTIIGYLVVTGDWKLLARLEIPRGVLLAAVVCLPWHFANFMKDGMGWLNEYVSTHLLGRAFTGTFGERGTFDYFFSQLGVGMWPWVCLVPVALVALLLAGRPTTRQDKLRAMFAVWGIIGFAFFVFVQTKFHHYILPAVPGLALVVAFWLDDVWAGRVRGPRLALAVAAVLFVVTTIDVVTRQERFVHLYIFRYFDRPWPYAPPWKLDFKDWILSFGLAFGTGMLAMAWARLRRLGAALLLGTGVAFAIFMVDVLMVAAADHWGQRNLHEVYYRTRQIHGVDLTYHGPERLVRDWASGEDLEVRSVIPETLRAGAPMKITWELRNAQQGVQEKGELAGTVASIDEEEHRFTIAVPAEERARLAPLLEAHRDARDDRRRFVAVNADRMIAWQLNWRGENFYSGGEIWTPRHKDMQTVFKDTDNTAFLDYLRPRIGQGRTFYVVTEIGRVANLRSILPTAHARETFTEMDRSSNKFGLARFTLDDGSAPAMEPKKETR